MGPETLNQFLPQRGKWLYKSDILGSERINNRQSGRALICYTDWTKKVHVLQIIYTVL